MESIVARKMHRTLEPFHGMIYFCPEAGREYRELGSTNDRTGYFASRAAPMGAVSTEVVTATFFNFHHDLVAEAMVSAWDVASPSDWIEARQRGADAALRRHLEDAIDGLGTARAAELARIAAEACWTPGRPLAAGLLGLEWPAPAHLSLWHSITITREFRGDGHVAALVAANVTPVEALVLHAGTGQIPAAGLRTTRAWPEKPWNQAGSDLRERGLIDDQGRLTASGQAFRGELEAQTDRAAMAPWEVLGQERCDELRGLVRPYSKAIVDGGAFGL